MAEVFDVATPAGSDAISGGDDRIRELKLAVRAALRGQTTEGLEAVFPGAAPLTAPVFRPRFPIGTTGARPAASADQGIYINTTKNTIQRCNDAAWVDVATLIPATTGMVFYQASAPTGWTAVAVNDMLLKVVTAGGSGGSTGGSTAFSSCWAATTTGAEAAHTHLVSGETADANATGAGSAFSAGAIFHRHNVSITSGAGSSHSHTVTAYVPQHADVILAQKD